MDKNSLEFFIEGTRSRNGKMLRPKSGLLNTITDLYFQKSMHDIYFVPIHINYEKVLEIDSYISELLGDSKTKETLGRIFSATSIFN